METILEEANQRRHAQAIRDLDLDNINKSLLTKSESAIIAKGISEAINKIGVACGEALKGLKKFHSFGVSAEQAAKNLQNNS